MPDDDPTSIPNGTRLFRRINPAFVVWDKIRGERRPTSQNFRNSQEQEKMSVFAENIAAPHNETPRGFLSGRFSEWFLVALPAEWMRENAQKVYPDPDDQEPAERYESHSAVEGAKKERTRVKLGEKYEWVVAPPNRFEPK